jgi:hypothetical protein
MIIEFTRGKNRYRVESQGGVLVGYVDGAPTVISKREEIVVRLLVQKRMNGQNTAEIAPFPRLPVP